MIANEPEENYKTGYIKIYRSLKKHWIWGKDKKTKFEAWVDLLLMASHSGTKEPIGYDLITVNEGQVFTSQEKLSIQWRWDRNAVRKFLDMLQKDSMIIVEPTTKYTMITICNYDSYQNKKPTKNQQSTNAATSTQHQERTYNNDNNDNNVNKSINSDFDVFWDAYDKKVDKFKCQAKFNKLGKEEIEKILSVVKSYVESTPDIKFRKNPLTWLNGKCWNDVQQNNNINGTQRKMVW